MVVLFGTDDRYVSTLDALLSGSFALNRADTWRDVERASAASACVVVAIDWLQDSSTFQQLIQLTTRRPLLSVVLITRKDADNARCLRHLILEEVVWRRDASQQIESVVHAVEGKMPLRHVLARLAVAPRIPPQLRAALVHACMSDRPVLSVTDLAPAVGRDRCTLSRQWRTAVGRGATARLEDFLRWLLLLRAVELRACGRKWAMVADELGVHPHTLSRVAARLTECSLGDLSRGGPGAIFTKFDEQVLSSLVSENATECDTVPLFAATQEFPAA